MDLETPLDHNGSFEAQLIKKGQTRITGMDEQILSLYAKGMRTVLLDGQPLSNVRAPLLVSTEPFISQQRDWPHNCQSTQQ